jgi:haloalkane dehalogenase
MANISYSTKKLSAIRDIYPFELHWFDLDGLRYHYLDEGPDDAPVVVMVHGNPTWSFYYRKMVRDLKENYRVIVPDHIGCGLSDKPQNYNYTLEQHIQNLEKLIETLALEDITLMMHDWGGAIGTGYATRHSENISKLIILNTAAFYKPVVHFSLRFVRMPLIGDILIRGFNGFVRTALFTAVTRRLSSQVRKGYLTPYNNWRNRVAVLRFVQDIPWEDDHPTRKTLNEIDSRLTMLRDKPMLICWGAKDFVFNNAFLDGWRERFPDADVHVFEDVGHYTVEDAHERILPLARVFLNEN